MKLYYCILGNLVRNPSVPSKGSKVHYESDFSSTEGFGSMSFSLVFLHIPAWGDLIPKLRVAGSSPVSRLPKLFCIYE